MWLQVDTRVEEALRAALRRGLQELCRVLGGSHKRDPIPLLSASMGLQADAFAMELQPPVLVSCPMQGPPCPCRPVCGLGVMINLVITLVIPRRSQSAPGSCTVHVPHGCAGGPGKHDCCIPWVPIMRQVFTHLAFPPQPLSSEALVGPDA